jgi:hypothetical protein
MSDTPYVVLDGYIHSEKDGELTLITLGGEQITVQPETIHLSVPTGTTSDKKAVRLFLKRGTVVTVQIAAEAFRGIGDGTIYKYMDDGGTPSKSRDDIQSATGL